MDQIIFCPASNPAHEVILEGIRNRAYFALGQKSRLMDNIKYLTCMEEKQRLVSAVDGELGTVLYILEAFEGPCLEITELADAVCDYLKQDIDIGLPRGPTVIPPDVDEDHDDDKDVCLESNEEEKN